MGIKNIDFWEKLLSELPDSYKEWFEEEEKYLVKNITKDAKVLEVGCGDGRSIKDILEVTTDIIGIDHDETAVKDAKENFKDQPKIEILDADARNLPFEDNSFDFVLCLTTFANFGESKFKALNEMKRVLKTDGNIIISVFSEEAFEERMKIYKKLNCPIEEIKGTTVIFADELIDNTSEQFSEKELKEIFNKANLNIIEIKKLNIAYICNLKK
jgi:ubiquinone/menaquinone biosynthesis C-methylase UbiE